MKKYYYSRKWQTLVSISINGIDLNYLLKLGSIFIFMVCLISCQSNSKKAENPDSLTDNSRQESQISENDTSVDDDTILDKSTENYNSAKTAYLKNTNDSDALIWYGRRAAYLGNFQQAIEIFTEGINKHPKDARMYRHRGHRYISTRQYDKAISDFEMAVTLIKDQKDQIEPDGLPNKRNIPIGTLHGNIWYHLGLAYYLKNDMDKALGAFSNRTVTEMYPDNIVSGGHWQYMILRRLGKTEEADNSIKEVTEDMDIIENMSYHKMCLFYKQLITQAELVPKDSKSSSDNVLIYGLGNWYLYHKQDTSKARQHYTNLLENGNKYSFAYLAAEADWERIFKSK